MNKFNKIRFLFKYPLKKLKITRTNAYNVEIPIEINEEKDSSWILYKFSPTDYINKNLIKYKEFSSLKGITEEKCIFKSFAIFSTIHIRGIFISNKEIKAEKLPKEMSVRGDKTDLNMYYIDLVENKEIRSKPNSIKDSKNNSNLENNNDYNNNEINIINNNIYNDDYNNYFNKKDNLYDIENSKIDNTSISSSVYLSKPKRKINKKSSFSKNKDTCPKKPLYPDPILSLNYIIGYTSKNCPTIKFNSFGDYTFNNDINKETKINQTKKYFYFCSGSNIIKYDSFNKTQKFFIGHSKSISHFIIGCKGEILFSGEEGVNSIIRVWKVENFSCIKMLTTPLDKLKSLSESIKSKFLCVAGTEQLKELIIIFKIEDLNNINIYIRKNLKFIINSIKFVPYSDEVLISCGKENIKFYRIKNNNLYEKSVVLSQYSKNNFLCIDFNKSIFGDNYSDKGKAYIGSSSGAVFQISCLSQELESVYLIQNSPILSLASNEIFVVTGSEDGYCRVWPVGFEEFIMEAKHDSGVCSVDISYDSIDILCGSLNGSIGILNIYNKNYHTLFRSPNSDITLLFLHPLNNFIFTVENNENFNNLRIWDLQNKEEIFNFKSENDLINCVNADLLKKFVCGFTSGIIKVFDFEKSELIYQCKPFKSPVNDLIYIQSYDKLIAMSSMGNLSVHDCNLDYKQIKIINIGKQCLYSDISLSVEQNFFATIGPESKHVLTWNSESLAMKNNINIINNIKYNNNNKNIKLAKKLCMVNKNLLGVGLDDCSIRFYALGKFEGIFIKEIKDIHIKSINKFICSKNYSYFLTSGEEGLIKIWDMKMIFNNYKSYQQYIGHSNGVNGLALIDNKGIVISSSKNNGIYFWNFLGDIASYDDNLIKDLDQLNDPIYIKNLKIKLNNQINSVRNSKSLNKYNINYFEDKKEQFLTKNMRIQHNEREYYAENPELEENYHQYITNIDFCKQEINLNNKKENEYEFKLLPKCPNEEEEEKISIHYSNEDYIISKNILEKYDTPDNKINSIKYKLLFTSKYLPYLYNNSNIIKSSKKKKNKKNINNTNNYKLDLEYCLGLSIYSMNNIVFNKKYNWYAYTANNKIIIEYLNTEKKQKILSDSKDELSCLILSNDLKYLISGIGQINKDEYASIFIYDTISFELIRRLNLHPKGIQYITLSKDAKFMLTIGTKNENSVCLWNFTDFKIIDMKTLNFSPFTAIIENNFNIYNKVKFITTYFDIISFWELDDKNKLENIDLKLEDMINFKNDDNEFITGLTLYKEDFEINDKYLLILTNKGNIIMIDNFKKEFIKKYLISKFPLTKIYYSDYYFICAGEGPLLYFWKFTDDEKNNFSEFLEIKKPNLLFFDGKINSISLPSISNECILSTDKGSLFYANLEEKNSLKILSSHPNTTIISMFTDISDSNLFTLGKEKNICCWTVDSMDQKYLIKKKKHKPNNFIYNYQDNILLTQYENSYLSAFDIKNFKSLGKIYIPNEDISEFCYIFDYQYILLITFQINIYIISIKNYDPLSMLYSLIDIPKNNVYYPYEQKCTSIICSNLDNDNTNKASSAFNFSNGDTSIFIMEKSNSKIIYDLIDNFNIILIHSKENNDENSNELYKNLINFRSEYKSAGIFSKQYDGVIICYHEALQFILIRDFIKKINKKIIAINYFPYCIDINDNGNFIALGTKEGIIIFISDGELKYYNNYCEPVLYRGHYDSIYSIKFSQDSSILFTSSKNEILSWSINLNN